MDNPIITQVIEQMHDLPLDVQEQILEFVTTLRQTNSQNSDADAWDVLESLIGTVEAPSDWSSQHDHYLYGTPKKTETALSEDEQPGRVTFTMHVRQQLKLIKLLTADPVSFDTFAADAGFYEPEGDVDNRDRLHRILDGIEEISEDEGYFVLYALDQRTNRRAASQASEVKITKHFMKDFQYRSASLPEEK